MSARASDVLIAGAGPAGAHLALRLARAGWSVTLIDRQRFPRPKPCGEFLSPECLPLLEDVGLREATLALGASRLAGMRIHGHGHAASGRYVRVGHACARFDHGYAVRRETLDALAVERAGRTDGIRLLEGFKLEALLRGGDGRVRGARVLDPAGEPHELRASFTIGADGLQSRVARQLGAARALPWLRRYAIVARFAAPRHELAEVHLFPGGYFAAAPIDGGAFTVNLVVGAEALSGGGQAGLERDFRGALERAPALAARLAGADPLEPLRACGPLAGATARQTFDGAALVGDACGFVDPLTGEGLFFAMRGAELLALDLDRALRAGRTDAASLRSYARTRAREFGPRYAFARLLQRALRHPGLVERGLSLLARRPGLADLVVSLTGDYVPFRELLRPGVWGRALRNTPATALMQVP
jgi:menaquinone-9 beta-reductase